MSLIKAKLISSDGGGTIEFMFNPNQLAFSQRINLTKNSGSRTGRGLPKVNFAYPDPCILNIRDIVLDTYEESGGKSVITYLKPFEKAVNFAESGDGKDKRPPTYVFTWGNFQYIRCFITDLSYTLTMFLPDGTPVRAKLDLTLEEVDESTSQPGMTAPATVNRGGDTRSRRKGK
jgi:Contractile injection system tube protein